jgi:hypothetical protein
MEEWEKSKFKFKAFLRVKTIKKKDLPTKICPVCNRPFSWRKKWEKDWNEVKYCSEKCRRSPFPKN